MWIVAAVLSAAFAGLTAILSKCGVKNVNSNVATAIRTSVVLAFSWAIALGTGAYRTLVELSDESWFFLILSGLATGASWICYFKALSVGEVSKVAAIDKSSVILSVSFALLLFPDERTHLQIKLICLVLIGAGTFLACDIKRGVGRGERKGKFAYLSFALLSAVFAAATSILAKIGIRDADSNAATAIRTCIVFSMAWAIVLCRGEGKNLKKLKNDEMIFLFLSGIATGASWLCYYYAIQQGKVSVAVPVDKLSVVVTIIFSVAVLKEKCFLKAWIGLGLLTAGTACLAVFA